MLASNDPHPSKSTYDSSCYLPPWRLITFLTKNVEKQIVLFFEHPKELNIRFKNNEKPLVLFIFRSKNAEMQNTH